MRYGETLNYLSFILEIFEACAVLFCSAIRCQRKAIEKSFRPKFSFRRTDKREISLLN